MLQVLPKENPTAWTSHGAHLQHIVNAHAFYFGHTPQTNGALNSSLRQHQSSTAKTPAGLQLSTISIALDQCFTPSVEHCPRMEFEGEEAPSGAIRIEHCPQSLLPMEFPDEEEDNNNCVEEEKKMTD
jgi:hypothetical protein